MTNVQDQQWDTTTFDLGNVYERTKYPFEFNYTGDKIIRHVSASCGCTAANSDNGTVSGTIDTKAASPLNDYKALSKTITVTFMDNTKQILTIKGKVYKESVDLLELN